jgi:subtilisin family serine protease
MRLFCLAIIGLAASLTDISTALCQNSPTDSTGLEDLDLVGVGPLWAKGYDGNGLALAVLDSPVDPSAVPIAGKVVLQACFGVEIKDGGVTSICPDGKDRGDGEVTGHAAATCDWQGCTHGTSVAVVAAGNDTPALRVKGVAKGAQIVAAQVFSVTNECQAWGACVKPTDRALISFQTTLIRALEWVHAAVLEQRSTQVGPEIVAVIIGSGGSGQYSTSCNEANPFLTKQVQSLLAEDVAIFAPTGNDGYSDQVSSPACISGVIPIAALDKSGKLADFSNRNPLLVRLAAPGVGVHTVSDGRGILMSGTTLATPLAAGSYVILKQAFPDLSRVEIAQALERGGNRVSDGIAEYTALSLSGAFAYLEHKKSKHDIVGAH